MRSRRAAGWLAKKVGSHFEDVFKYACQRQGIVVTRMPDGCRTLGANRLMRVQTPFDWILTSQGKSAFIDTKSTEDNLFPAGKIKDHQLLTLLAHAQAGAIAGYVIQYRKHGFTAFAPVSRLWRCNKDRKGIAHDDCDLIRLGTLGEFDPRKMFYEEQKASE